MSGEKNIRFIDSHYRDLFRIPDGGTVILTYSDGSRHERQCHFIDEYHTEIGGQCWHICQFAEVMKQNGTTYAPAKEKGQALPYTCFSILPTGGDLIMIERGQRGYIKIAHSDRDAEKNRLTANRMNARFGVSKAQEEAMLAGSMFGWDVPGADPERYDEDGRPKPPEKKETERQAGSTAGYNAVEESYEEITVLGRPALFTSGRLDRSTVPDGLYQYEVRSDDGGHGDPVQIAKGIMVNHWGTILTREPVRLPPDGYLDIDPEKDWSYAGGDCRTVKEFMQKFPPAKKKERER